MSVVDDLAPEAFEHDAFVYDSDQEYLDALVPRIDAALQAGSHVHAVVSSRNADLLREALGRSSDQVTWIDARAWYEHPVRTIAAYERTLRDLRPGVSAFVIGEVQFGDESFGHAEWTRYEALLNRVLERYPARVICPYDVRRLPDSVVADAERTHPHLVAPSARRRSDRYVEPEDLVAQLGIQLPEPVGPPDILLDDLTSPQAARRSFTDLVTAAGFAPDRVDELALAVSELLTNAIRHGGGAGTLQVWLGDTLECIVDDRGTGSDDLLLGFDWPPPGAVGGYGLWCVRQVFERVELSRSPFGGLRVHAATSRSSHPAITSVPSTDLGS